MIVQVTYSSSMMLLPPSVGGFASFASRFAYCKDLGIKLYNFVKNNDLKMTLTYSTTRLKAIHQSASYTNYFFFPSLNAELPNMAYKVLNQAF